MIRRLIKKGVSGKNLSSAVDITATQVALDVFDEAIIVVAMPNATQVIDITVPFDFEVTDVVAIKGANAGGAGDQINLKKAAGGTTITGNISLNIAAKTLARVLTMDTAQTLIPKGTVLEVAMTKATDCAGRLLIYGVRRN